MNEKINYIIELSILIDESRKSISTLKLNIKNCRNKFRTFPYWSMQYEQNVANKILKKYKKIFRQCQNELKWIKLRKKLLIKELQELITSEEKNNEK